MDATHDAGSEQAARWNGPAGRAWVDAQDVVDRVFKRFEELLVEAVTAGAHGTTLDVGCGTGGTTVALARRLGANGRAIGIDISDTMIAAARARAERERTAAEFIRADAQRHRFEPASVDAIVSRFGVMFFDDPVAAFTNLRLAAKDEGRLRFIVWRSPAENPFMTTAERAAAPLLPNLPARRTDTPGQFAFSDRERVHTILKDSGWAAIEISPIDVDCSLPEPALRTYVERLGPVGLALQEADDRTRARVVDTVLVAFEPYIHGAEARFTAACWMADARVV